MDGSENGAEPALATSSSFQPCRLTSTGPRLATSMNSSNTSTRPSLFQSYAARGRNSLITGRGCGGRVRLGKIVGRGEGVSVTVVAQLARPGVPLIGLPWASLPLRTTPVFVTQVVRLS